MDFSAFANILKNLEYPIAKKAAEIHELIKSYNVCGINGEAGSGKSTVVPIICASGMQGRILVVQPRRLAAIAVCRRINELCKTLQIRPAGFIVRQEQDIRKTDRIVCVTTGVFLRIIASDPMLDGISAVLLDEIHERSVESDLCWLFSKNMQDLYRSDIKLVLLSASIGRELLENSGVAGFGWISVSGRLFPVDVEYRSEADYGRDIEFWAGQILDVCGNKTGDLLVFLPGEKEIKKVSEMISSLEQRDFLILQLFGRMDPEIQKQVLEKKSDKRRIILSTNIAQTSLTIEGISVVIDSGTEKTKYQYPGDATSSLITQRISASSALQRAGRAGRLGPGFCLRLWDKRENLEPRDTPAIFREDNARMILDLAAWGDICPDQYQWLDKPDGVYYQSAVSALVKMDLLDNNGQLTEKGKVCSQSTLAPAFASCVFDSLNPVQKTSILLTALLVDDRMGMNVPDDFSSHNPAQILKDSHFRMNAEKEASIFGFSLVAGNNTDFDYTALARSFCGSIGFRDRDCVYKLAGGPSLKLDQSSKLPESLLVLHSDHKTGTGLIYQYISLDFNILRLVLKSAAQTVEELYFDRERGTFSAIKKELFGTLVISETRMPVEKMSFFSRSFYDLLEKEGPSILDWKPNDVLLKQRMTCLRVADVADSSLVNALKKFYGESLNQPSQIRLQDVLLSMVEDSKRKFIQDLDEKKFRMENGRNAQLRYEKDGRIVVSARVQDFFGLSKNPVVAGISASVELLSPAGRPVQVTGDLGGFWKNSYQSVRKEMAGRYPKHNWPQNPLAG